MIKRIAGILLGAAAALGVIIAAISWYQMTPDERSAMVSQGVRIAAWIGIVLVLPWATAFITTAIARRESNGAGAILVAGYTIVDAAILAYLFGLSQHSSTAICLIALGILVALTYNLLTCDWIAEKWGDA